MEDPAISIDSINHSDSTEWLVGLLANRSPELKHVIKSTDFPDIEILNNTARLAAHTCTFKTLVFLRLINLLPDDEYVNIAKKHMIELMDYAIVINMIIRDKNNQFLIKMMELNELFNYGVNIDIRSINEENKNAAIINGFIHRFYLTYRDIEYFLTIKKPRVLVRIYGIDVLIRFAKVDENTDTVKWAENLREVLEECIMDGHGNNMHGIVRNLLILLELVYSIQNKKSYDTYFADTVIDTIDKLCINHRTETHTTNFDDNMIDIVLKKNILPDIPDSLLSEIARNNDVRILRKINSTKYIRGIKNIINHIPSLDIITFFINDTGYETTFLSKFLHMYLEYENYEMIDKAYKRMRQITNESFAHLSKDLSKKLENDNFDFLFEISKYEWFNYIVFDENILIEKLFLNPLLVEVLVELKYQHFNSKILLKILETTNMDIIDSAIYLFSKNPYVITMYRSDEVVIMYDYFIEKGIINEFDEMLLSNCIINCNDKLFEVIIMRTDTDNTFFRDLIQKIDNRYNELKTTNTDVDILFKLSIMRNFITKKLDTENDSDDISDENDLSDVSDISDIDDASDTDY